MPSRKNSGNTPDGSDDNKTLDTSRKPDELNNKPVELNHKSIVETISQPISDTLNTQIAEQSTDYLSSTRQQRPQNDVSEKTRLTVSPLHFEQVASSEVIVQSSAGSTSLFMPMVKAMKSVGLDPDALALLKKRQVEFTPWIHELQLRFVGSHAEQDKEKAEHSRPTKTTMRKIIHIDMDCFYAAVEIRDNPELRNRAVAVGGHPDRRGVIATCNYVAREYGVHSAMASAYARKLCPELIILPPNIKKYRAVSEKVFSLFKRYTNDIEPMSLDEAYLDVTETAHFQGSATRIAEAIRKDIVNQCQLVASAGVSTNKFLAKVASDWNKPNGIKVITPDEVENFMTFLPVKKLPGVGKVTAKKLESLSIRQCGDLLKYDLLFLAQHFGQFGQRLYELARGIDNRSVKQSANAKSISVERTFNEDLLTLDDCLDHIPNLLGELSRRIANKRYAVSTQKLFVKMKFSDFSQTTVEQMCDCIDIDVIQHLMKQAFVRRRLSVRLLGIGVRIKSDQNDNDPQLLLPFP